jgi:hypothetical protein
VLLTLLSIPGPKGRDNVNATLSENTGSGPIPGLRRVFDSLPFARYQTEDLEFLKDHHSNLNSAPLQS